MRRSPASRTAAVAVAAAALLGVGGCANRPVEHRMLFGTVADNASQVDARARDTGRPPAALRVFRRWGQDLADPFVRQAVRRYVVFLSVKARLNDGRQLRWEDIASARPGSALDREMRRQARQLKQLGKPVYFTFNHEPENKNSQGMGTPEQYAQAWRRVVSVFRAEGASNVRYVWTLTDASFAEGVADRYYPGDAWVDHIGVDAYNWFDCRGRREKWRSLADLIEPHRVFGRRHPDKGLMILEWGTVEDPDRPNRKARWLDEAARLFTRPEYRQYRALLHWDDRYTRGQAPARCNWDYTTSPAALAAWRRLAAEPVFSAADACDIGDCDGRGSLVVALAAGGAVLVTGTGALVLVRRLRRRSAGGPGRRSGGGGSWSGHGPGPGHAPGSGAQPRGGGTGGPAAAQQ